MLGFRKYPCLVYSLICDSGFCLSYAIITKGQISNAVIVDTTMRTSVKVSDILGGKNGHNSKYYHFDAVSAMNSFIKLRQTLPEKNDLKKSATNQQYWHILQLIPKVVLICGR